MNLRKLEIKDAPLMLEWMHDKNVTAGLQKSFSDYTLADCESFISASRNDKKNLHMAIADGNDTYMGTVSLKNINNNSAEFAIAVRTEAMGKGYSKFAMEKIIETGFNSLGLSSIYWYVLKSNLRAIRFYDKNGYEKVSGINEFFSEEQLSEQKYFYYLVKNLTFMSKA